jgi:hypothetical protein
MLPCAKLLQFIPQGVRYSNVQCISHALHCTTTRAWPINAE